MAESKDKAADSVVELAFEDESAKFNLTDQYYQAAPTEQLAFVNLTVSSGGTQDSGKRKLVRSHVQRNFRQRQQLQEYNEVQRFTLPRVVPYVPQSVPANNLPKIKDKEQLDSIQPDLSKSSEAFQWNQATNHESDQSLYGQIGPALQYSQVPRRSATSSNENGSIEKMGPVPNSSGSGKTTRDASNFDQTGHGVRRLGEVEVPMLESLGPNPQEYSLVNQTVNFGFLSRGGIDPFDTLPVIRNGRVRGLMYHYNQVLTRSMVAIAVDPDDKWFGFSITDPALFGSTMVHSAAHYATLGGGMNLADATSIKWEAMKNIQNRLSDPISSISDVTIGAVVALALFENQSANVELSNIHMEGLSRMVHLRGGLRNLGLAGILRRKILWADLCNSMYSHSKPRFGNVRSPKLGTKETNTSLTAIPTGEYQIYYKELVEMFDSLSSFSNELSKPFSRTNLMVDEIYYLEQRVVVLLAETHPTIQPGSYSFSDEQSNVLEHRQRIYQISLAALIYIYLYLRDFLVGAPIFSVLVSRLSNSLYSSEDMMNFWKAWGELNTGDSIENEWKRNILLWVLVIASLAANGREERRSFITSLRTIRKVLRVTTLIQLVEKLSKIAWIEKRVDNVLSELWDEIHVD